MVRSVGRSLQLQLHAAAGVVLAARRSESRSNICVRVASARCCRLVVYNTRPQLLHQDPGLIRPPACLPACLRLRRLFVAGENPCTQSGKCDELRSSFVGGCSVLLDCHRCAGVETASRSATVGSLAATSEIRRSCVRVRLCGLMMMMMMISLFNDGEACLAPSNLGFLTSF